MNKRALHKEPFQLPKAQGAAAQNLRAPLLHILLPCLAGFYAGEHFDVPILPLILCSLAFGLASYRTMLRHAILLWLASFCLAFAYYESRDHHIPEDRLSAPPREAAFTLKIVKLFSNADTFGRISGIAKVVQAPLHLKDYKHQSLAFQLLPKTSQPIRRKSEVACIGLLSLIPSEGSEPFYRYLEDNGCHYLFNRGQIIEVTREAPQYIQYADRIKDKLMHLLLDNNAPPLAKSIVASICLGAPELLSKSQKNAFINSATMHLFAISGLHIGIIGAAIFTLGKCLRLPKTIHIILTIILLLGYVLITGGTTSALRAFTMISIFWLAYLFKREPTPINALVVAAIVLLAIDPRQLWNPGFQLSFGVVMAILLYGLPLAEKLKRISNPLKGIPQDTLSPLQQALHHTRNYSISMLSVSFAAFIASAPLIAQLFGIFAPSSIFLSVIMIPLVGLLLLSTLLALSLYLILGNIGLYLLNASWAIAYALDAIVKWHDAFPLLVARIECTHPSSGEFGLLMVTLSILSLHKVYLDKTSKMHLWSWSLPAIISLACLLFG